MAELPEIAKLTTQMHHALQGKTIESITLLQEKCANIPAIDFQMRIAGTQVTHITHKGKWIITALNNGEHILLSLGMGADILYFENEKGEPEKYQIKLLFTDGSGYTARFWWFGKFLLTNDLSTEPNTRDIAPDPFDPQFTPTYFQSLLKGKKTQIKAFLLNQKNIGGIGNMYMHDILFKSRLHPQRKISDLNEGEIQHLYDSIFELMNLSKQKGAFEHENDFHGQKGGYTMDYFLVGYKENQPCPTCGTTIIQMKTGSTTSFLCPACQKL